MNKDAKKEVVETDLESFVEITENGPILAYGNIKVKYPDGKEEKRSKVTALCRCGASNNKPYCDGSHKKIDFKG